jgi:arginase
VAVKIVRQINRIALLGAPVSAAALAPGGERAPAALRKAGLVSRLQSIGYEVSDAGDDPPQLFQEDDKSPRARNLPSVLAALEALRPRVEIVAKSGALPLILGGDCTIVLATIAGLRRYFRHVSLLYVDADAGLQTPATTPSGCVDGMVVSHVVGRGASELVRFWSEPPLVREPDVALFGVSRLDPAEEQALQTSPLRRYLAEDIRRKSVAKAASEAIERIHATSHEFVLHFDLDAIAGFQATNLPSASGLTKDELREALAIFVTQPHLAAINVTGYNPDKDADGSAAESVVEFWAGILALRKENFKATAPSAKTAPAAAPTDGDKPADVPAAAPTDVPAPVMDMAPEITPGEAWSSDILDAAETTDPPESADRSTPANFGETEDPPC